MAGWSMVLDNDDGSLSVRRADCALSKISMHKGTSAMLEPKRSQYADVMNDYNTSATAFT